MTSISNTRPSGRDDKDVPALEVTDLVTRFTRSSGELTAVDHVSLRVGRGEIMALVGESGSGKSVTGLSLMGLVDPPGHVSVGSLTIGEHSIDLRDDRGMRAIRGARLAMVFQDPMMTLNPVLPIARQMTEAITAHHPRTPKKQARERARQALVQVGIAAPDERLNAYPHQLSGGMRQRVAIAIALLNAPDVIIADEPTTALDVTIQNQILYEIEQICRNSGTALIWITHDLSVVANLATSVSVMYAGRIVEHGATADILNAPLHPYTQGLIESVPDIDARKGRLRTIPGMAPRLDRLPGGCKFSPRCAWRVPACESEPALYTRADGRAVRCLRPLDEVD